MDVSARDRVRLYLFSTPHNSFSRIDFFITDKWTLQRIESTSIGGITWSDHTPVVLKLTSDFVCPNTEIWQFNPFLLADKHTTEAIREARIELFKYNELPDTKRFTLWGHIRRT